MTKTVSRRRIAPATVSAVSAALCASFTAGSAHAVAIAVDITDVTLSPSNVVTIDINGDGIPEYVFRQNTGPLDQQNSVDTSSPLNSVVGYTAPPASQPVNGTYATALALNDIINFSTSPGYVSGSDVILSGSKLTISPSGKDEVEFGQFLDSGVAYVGLKFDIPGGSIHFGWVEVNGGNESNLTVTRYGYECEKEVGIAAGAGDVSATCAFPTAVPEPGSLALLIAGAAGILALRRRQRASP